MPKVEETPSHTLAYKHFLVLHQPSQESSDNFTSFCPWSGFVVRIYRALHLTQSLLWKSLASRHFCVCGFKPKGSSAMLKQPKNQNSSCQSCAHVNTHQTEPPQKNRWKPRKPSISSSESWLRHSTYDVFHHSGKSTDCSQIFLYSCVFTYLLCTTFQYALPHIDSFG